MLLYIFPAFVAPFYKTSIIKANVNNGINPPSCPFLAVMAIFSDITFMNEEATVCINEETIGAINEAAISIIKSPRNASSCFF